MAKLDQISVKGTTYELVPEVAPLFNTSTAYAVGDYVIKDAVLYRFKTAHASGAWSASQVDEVTAGSELKSIRNDKLDKNQGIANAGKYLKVGADGNVETADLDVTTDKTLSVADKAADAKAVGDELTDLKTGLNLFADVTKVFTGSFRSPANTGHSSLNDLIYVNIKAGEKFTVIVSVDTETTNTYQLRAFYSDGTQAVIDTWYIGRETSVLTAEKDIVNFGLSINALSVPYRCNVTINLSNSAINKVDKIAEDLTAFENDVLVSSSVMGTYVKYFEADGSVHSATIATDQIIVDMEAGNGFYVSVNINITPSNNSCQIWGYDIDGNATLIGTQRFNIAEHYTTANNIAYIGVSIPAQSSSYSCSVVLNASDSVVERTKENESNIESLTQKTGDLSAVTDSEHIYAKTFSSDGLPHSSTIDRLAINIAENESFKINVSLNITPSANTFQCYALYSDGTSERLTTNYIGNDVFLIAKKEIAMLGFTIPAQSAAYVCTCIVDLNIDMQYLNQSEFGNLLQAKRTINLTPNAYKTNIQPLVLLHFSDLHAEADNLRRIVQYKEFLGSLIDDVICTGDMVSDRYNDGMEFWSEVSGSDDILMVIGNHDALAGDSGHDWTNTVPQSDLYNTFIAPYVENWNCTYTQNLTYYYKDYANKKVRLICLNCMLLSAESDAQLSWFETTLTEAKNLGYYVIVATHYPINDASKIVCNFSSLDKSQTNTLNAAYINAVDNYIANGGKFGCYIAGHTHWDDILKANNHNQMCIVVDAAGANVANVYSDTQRTIGEKSWDCANLFVFDGDSGTIKIIRAGANQDHYLRNKNNLTLKLNDCSVVTQN